MRIPKVILCFMVSALSVSPPPRTTKIQNVVFSVATSTKLWVKQNEYIKLWYRAGEMHGTMWLDDVVEIPASERGLLPPARISEDAFWFPYSNTKEHHSAIRISQIVSEMVQMGPIGARWLVMGHDDTVFIVENLLHVLRRYDHEEFYYMENRHHWSR